MSKKNNTSIVIVRAEQRDGKSFVPYEDFINAVERTIKAHNEAVERVNKQEKRIQELIKKIKQLRKMIDIAIGYSYDKDNDDAMEYLINEKDQYPELRD